MRYRIITFDEQSNLSFDSAVRSDSIAFFYRPQVRLGV
jgi:hypothetical protein